MNEFNQEEISRNRAERSNRALRNLCIGAGSVVGFGLVINVISPVAGLLYCIGLGITGITAQRNLRRIQSSSEQE